MALIRSVSLVREPLTLPRRPQAPIHVVAPVAPPRLTAENERERELMAQLETIRLEAHEAGLRAGRAQGLREGREKGLMEGRESAKAKVEAEFGAQVAALAAFLKNARGRVDQQIIGLDELCAEIAFESVTKILGRSLLQPEGVMAVVREAVRRVRDRRQLMLRVSPRDYAVIDAHRGRFQDGLDEGRVEIVADERVELGGCLIETPGGTLDARLEVQLAELRHALLSAHALDKGNIA